MPPIPGSFAAFREPVDRAVFAPGFDLWERLQGGRLVPERAAKRGF